MAGPRPRNLPLFATAENCSNRTFIVTGANSGLGFEATKHLVAAGASKVIMAVRNISAGEEAKLKIEEELHSTGVAEVWPIDLASYASVKAFAARASTELPRIDGVLENAGVFDFKRIMAENHLSMVTVNVISTFLLAVFLLPKMSQSARDAQSAVPHLTVVGSSYGFSNQESWDSIKDDPLVKMDAEKDNVMLLYHLTKLLDIMAVHQLSSLFPVSRTGVVINVVAPGLCKTSLARNAPPEFQANIAERAERYGRTAEEGSRVLLHGLFAGKESHGQYLDSCEIAEERLPSWMANEDGKLSEKRAWEVVARDLEAIEPGCLQKLQQL